MCTTVHNTKMKIHRTISLHVFNGFATWSITLREESKLTVFENRVLRGIFEPKRDEVRGEWRKLHIEELNDLYSSPYIIRVIKSRMGWVRHVTRMAGEKMNMGFWWGNLRERETWKTQV